VVLSKDDAAPNDSRELADDIIAINAVFICQLQGRRAGQYHRLRRQQQQEVRTQEIASSQITDLVTRSIKVRVYPNAKQKQLMRQWMGCAR